jgi:hypothetical protein
LGYAPIFAKTPDFEKVHDEFKRGNYNQAATISIQYIKSQDFLNYDERFLVIYITGEKQINEIHWVLKKSLEKKPDRSSIFYNAVYLLLERSLVLKDINKGMYWGAIYEKEGGSSKKYEEGMYLYACILLEAGKKSQSLAIAKKYSKSQSDIPWHRILETES